MMPRPPRPALVGEDIVCISSIDWDFLWQAHQEIMSRLAADGNPVLFVENTGVRVPGLSDLPRLASRLRNWWNGVQGFRERAPNLIVLSPLLLPFPYSWVCRKVNAWLLGRSINRWVGATKRSSPILWTFLPTPIVNDLIDDLDPALVVYYCADNLAASSSAAEAIAASERRLFERADLVFVTSREIQQRACRSRPAAHFFPFGVDFARFAGRAAGAPEPSDIAAIPHPRVGYVGGIHRWMDFDLLAKVALERPTVQFVLVGPEQAETAPLKGLTNLHFLGVKPHSDLPAYISAFDAAIIPYRLTEYTNSVYPTKLNEYFAGGVPIVSTALPEVIRYNEENGRILHIARDARSFVAALDSALSTAGQGRDARIAAASANSWDGRIQEMTALMAQKLSENRSEPKVFSNILFRVARRWQPRMLALSAAAWLAVSVIRWTPLPWLLAEPLRYSVTPSAADAAVILGGGAGESGEIGQGHQERLERALQLRNQGLAPDIVLCSGKVQNFSESEVMRAIALSRGVPDKAIHVELRANGTKQMIVAASRLARDKGWRRVLVISSPYHMRRAIMTWRKHAPDIEAIPAPVLRSRFYGIVEANGGRPTRRGATFRQTRGLLQEAGTFAYYRMRGWL